jgi:hypothetical protein
VNGQVSTPESKRGTHFLSSAKGQVRLRKESEPARLTHQLENEEGKVRKHKESKRLVGHSLSEEHREGIVKTLKESERGKGTHGLWSIEVNQVRTQRESKWGALTNWRAQSERNVRAQDQRASARNTHVLLSTEKGVSKSAREGDARDRVLTNC